MIIDDEILIFHALRYSDDQLIVEGLARNYGRVSFVVRISHAPRAKVRHVIFQPMAVLEVQWEEKPRAKLMRPIAARVSQPWSSLHTSPIKAAITLFLAEFLLQVCRHEQSGELFFDYLLHSLTWLDTAEEGFANFHLLFLMRLAQFLGIAPNTSDTGLPFFDLMAAEFVSRAPAHAYYIYGDEARAFEQLLRMNFSTMHLFQLTRTQRNRILELILTYYRLHIPSLPELKSWEVLREIFT
ncbi:DNA repair protein RecO [Alloprevotella sp. oral taxon 473]|jgi:recombination protein O C terminal|uniref:DNA repair protein RecO n=1 Tax=Alloprevotella sp. oral taxon 473 TaxID=712469 RepID=UPI0002A241A5|nr:DNA repair protein RecO C-terminal domain-containing protein [Alloprevotella sp. oral taxon 473]EKX91340.1 DNA repair protein RecO [Alloprevotella sp. oral taxon 473 str. F0040]